MYNSFNTWGWLESIDPYIKKNINIISGDIRDYKFVKNAITKSDIVFHLASLIAIPYSYHSPNSYLQTNVQGTLNVLEASLDSNIEKIIHTSTSEVYGDTKIIPISEQTPIISKSPYSATKIAADQLAYSYYSSFDLPVSIIRPFNTYGPRQSARAVIPTIVTQAILNKKIRIGNLTATRDFLFVEDLCVAYEQILKSNKLFGEVVNVGMNSEISIKNLIIKISKILKIKLTPLIEKKRIRPKKSEVSRLKCDNKKLKETTNWKPKYKIDDGLLKLIEWMKKDNNMKNYKPENYNI